MVFNLHFPDDSDAEHPFMCLVAMCYVFFHEVFVVDSFSIFYIRFFIFLHFENSLHVVDACLLSNP